MPAILTIITGSISFTLSWIFHICFWKTRRPVKQVAALTVIFIIIPLFAYLVLFIGGRTISGIRDICPISCTLFMALAALWHLALSLSYIMTYPPIQTGCPSLLIVRAVHQARPEGLSENELIAMFTDRELLTKRIKDLTGDGFIKLKDEAWGLNLSGKIIGRIFHLYRRVLNLPRGEG